MYTPSEYIILCHIAILMTGQTCTNTHLHALNTRKDACTERNDIIISVGVIFTASELMGGVCRSKGDRAADFPFLLLSAGE